jgi:hypothetical protein
MGGMIMQASRQREPILVAISGYERNSRTIFCERQRNSISPAQHRVGWEISAISALADYP